MDIVYDVNDTFIQNANFKYGEIFLSGWFFRVKYEILIVVS